MLSGKKKLLWQLLGHLCRIHIGWMLVAKPGQNFGVGQALPQTEFLHPAILGSTSCVRSQIEGLLYHFRVGA